MAIIIVYPNNTVSIDGCDVNWDDEEFKKRKVTKYGRKSIVRRTRRNKDIADIAEHRHINGDTYIIFPNINPMYHEKKVHVINIFKRRKNGHQ